MNSKISSKLAQLNQLCQHYRVTRMELFGSATNETFDSELSDLDFLVQFSSMPPAQYADCFFGLREALENLFERSIDLVELTAIDNPYFLEAIAPQRITIYAA